MIRPLFVWEAVQTHGAAAHRRETRPRPPAPLPPPALPHWPLETARTHAATSLSVDLDAPTVVVCLPSGHLHSLAAVHIRPERSGGGPRAERK